MVHEGFVQEASRVRHVYGIGLAFGLSLAVFFAGGWGYLRLLRVPVINGATSTLPAGGGELLHNTNVLYAVAAVGGTGLLAGTFIAVRRISPLAAGLPGLGLIAWTVGYGFSVRQAVRYIPLRHEAFGAGFEAMLMNGVLAAAGLALVVPLFIPSRWRSPRPQPVLAETWDAADAAQAPTAAIPLLGDWAGTAPYPDGEHFRS
jgi:hypothetical protein